MYQNVTLEDKKLKILVVVTEFPSVSETFIMNQIAELIDRGHDVTIFSYCEPSSSITHQIYYDYQLNKKVFTHFKNRKNKIYVIKGGVNFIWKNFRNIKFSILFSFLNFFEWKKNRELFKIYYDFPLYVLKHKYDVMHCHFGFNGVKVAKAEKNGISLAEKKVISFHGSDVTPSKISIYKDLYKNLFEVFDTITVNSPYLENLLLSVNPNIKNRIVLPVGFNSKYIEIEEVSKFEKTNFDIVFCGRLIPLKRPEAAIEITNQLVKKGYANVKLHLIGSGEMFETIKRNVIELEIQNNVILYGSLEQKEVYRIMSFSDVFLFPGCVDSETGLAETQGLVIQEAQFLKLPVVVSDVGGIKYGMLKNESGFLLESTDIAIFVEKLIELMENPILRKKMGEKGHEFVKEKFSSTKLGDQLLRIYENN